MRRVLELTAGLIGVVAAVALPFASVVAEQASVTWPSAGHPAASTTAFFVPYRPAELTVKVPATAVSPGASEAPVTVFATGPADAGLVIETGAAGPRVRVDGRDVVVPAVDVAKGGDLTVHADEHGVTVSDPAGPNLVVPGARVPRVFGFRTDLPPDRAAGISAAARSSSVFATSPTLAKLALVIAQLLAAGAAVALLMRSRSGRDAEPPDGSPPAGRARRGGAVVDIGVVGVLAAWAVIGPLAVDDGWATTIARTYASSGNPGNYYRWWNASETPFALWEQMIAPLVTVSVAPMWLRIFSTVLAVATWFVVSRGVLGAALPTVSSTTRMRAVAAVFFLAAWMPFNLGVRPEGAVALGATAVLALLWRAQRLGAIAAAVLVAAVTFAVSPTAVIVVAPFVVFAPRIARMLRDGCSRPGDLVVRGLLLAAVAAVSLTVVFADQTWDGFVTATEWHRFFGPSLPPYHELDRYQYLLGTDQMGSFAKRLPVLLSVVFVPIVGLIAFRRRDAVTAAAARLAGVVAVSLVLMSVAPSKWSYHLGALAGAFAAFLAVAVVLVVSPSGSPRARGDVVLGLIGGGLTAAVAALGFAGPNAWWLPELYRVPWAMTGPRPFGVPLQSVVFWGALLLVGIAVPVAVMRARGTGPIRRVIAAGPAVITLVALSGSVVIMLGSFASAPVRRPEGSLAQSNWRWLIGRPSCGFADSVEVLADGDILTAAGAGGSSTGFTALGGFARDAPPPDRPGTGMSTYLWGSRDAGPGPATLTSQWFTLTTPAPGAGLSASIAGTAGATISFEFGHSDQSAEPSVVPVARVDVTDPAPPDLNARERVWRAVTVDASQTPAEADRVRLHVDSASGGANWVAISGPRRNIRVSLTDFLLSRPEPVLLSWQQSFVFPCVRDIARVADGIAKAPRVMVVAPGPWFTEPEDVRLGGVFAGLQSFGGLYQIPTQVIGHPDMPWGAVLLSGAESTDAYDLSVDRVRRPGRSDRDSLYAPGVPP